MGKVIDSGSSSLDFQLMYAFLPKYRCLKNNLVMAEVWVNFLAVTLKNSVKTTHFAVYRYIYPLLFITISY